MYEYHLLPPVYTKYPEKIQMPTGTDQILWPHLVSKCLSAGDSTYFPFCVRMIIFLFSGQHLYAIYLSSLCVRCHGKIWE